MEDAEFTRLRLVRRHLKTCKFWKSERWRKEIAFNPEKKTLPENWLECSCPLHLKGTENGRPVRESLNTRNLDLATALLNQRIAVATGLEKPKTKKPSKAVDDAVSAFLSEHEKVLGTGPGTIKKYRVLLARDAKDDDGFSPSLMSFSKKKGFRYLSDLETDHLIEFMTEWKDRHNARKKKFERLKSFFNHAKDRSWIETNPAERLKPPKGEDTAIVAYTDDEVSKLLKAAREKGEHYETVALVMLHSGLAPVDVVQLTPERLIAGRLNLRREKTGTWVGVQLPPLLVARLQEMERTKDGYWFWNRESGKLETATGNLRRGFRSIFKEANVVGHLYRFRHTFVYRRRRKGASYEQIARLLGNSPAEVAATYAHFLPEEQTDLDVVAQLGWNEADFQSNK